MVAVLVALSSSSHASFAASPTSCTATQTAAGLCDIDAGLTDDEAVLTGTVTGSGGNDGGGETSTEPETCTRNGDGTCSTDLRPDFAVFNPTLNDIAAFRPVPNVDHMEPNGWFVTGLPANFYATGGASTDAGELLGLPASVRFTPIRWHWTYGDGSSATRSTRGSTWSAQGIPEFEPTPTSHVYARPGTYYIDLTVGYHADYSFDSSGWAPIPGILWLPANRLVATVGGAKTVLVEHDCAANPSGPGC